MPVVAVVTWLYLCIATMQPNYNCYYYGKRRFLLGENILYYRNCVI